MKSERIYVRVSEEEKKKLEKLAKEEKRTLSGLVRFTAQEYIKNKEETKMKKMISLLNGDGTWEDIELGSEYLNNIPDQEGIDFIEELQGGEKLKVVYKNGDELFFNDIHGSWGSPVKFQ